MRVLLVNAHGADATAGGAERYVADLGSGLRARGFDVAVLSAFPVRDDQWPGETLVRHTSDWRTNRVRRLRNHAGDVLSEPTRALEETVAAARPDLVHTNNLPGFGTGIWEVCRRLGVPVVHTIHDYYLLCPRTTLLRRDGRPCRPHPLLCGVRTRRLARWAGAVGDVIPVSQYVRERHAVLFPNARMHVVSNPFTPLRDGAFPPPRSPPRSIGYLGALGLAKGVRELLAAAPGLARLGYSVQIAGDGPLRAAVEAAAAGPGVRYAGIVGGAEKTRFIRDTDLAIVPSVWPEPGAPPYTVWEWLAAGRPVLAAARGGLEESAARLPGVLPVEPSGAAIVAAAERLLDPDVWRRAVADAAATSDDWGLDAWVDAHAEIYRGASARGRAEAAAVGA